MKITINENDAFEQTEIVINCAKTDEEILKLISMLKQKNNKIAGTKNEQTFVLVPNTILYCESVDKKTFIYCETEVYDTQLKLYEIEERLITNGFARASKTVVVNLMHIKSLRPDFGARLVLTMDNGENIMASRQYAAEIKQKLGI